jgi:hypothetical protein
VRKLSNEKRKINKQVEKHVSVPLVNTLTVVTNKPLKSPDGFSGSLSNS